MQHLKNKCFVIFKLPSSTEHSTSLTGRKIELRMKQKLRLSSSFYINSTDEFVNKPCGKLFSFLAPHLCSPDTRRYMRLTNTHFEGSAGCWHGVA